MESNFPQASRGDVLQRPLAFEPGKAALYSLSLLCQRLALRWGEYLSHSSLSVSDHRVQARSRPVVTSPIRIDSPTGVETYGAGYSIDIGHRVSVWSYT